MVTKQHITEAAFKLFALKGFYETSTENIANALGIKKQSLYSHFKSKGEIILAVLQEHAEHINKEIEKIIGTNSDKSTEALLKSIFEKICVYFSQRDRLLLWKRIRCLDENGEYKEILQNIYSQLKYIIHVELGGILKIEYPHFNSPEIFRSFFTSYIILISGYMDWMLFVGYDSNTIESTWENFWQGMNRKFLANTL